MAKECIEKLFWVWRGERRIGFVGIGAWEEKTLKAGEKKKGSKLQIPSFFRYFEFWR